MLVATLACHNYRKRQAEYVNNLFRACNKHITTPFAFVCFTDDAAGFDPGVEVIHLPGKKVAWGWWNKLYALGGGVLPKGERVLFVDLDTLILRNIDDLAAYQGPFAGLGCARSNRLFSSGIMAWEAGTQDHVWDEWLKAGKPILGSGDDEWINKVCPHAHRLQHKFPGLYQYKYHRCAQAPPPGARIIYYAREPKPDNCGGWAQHYWTTLEDVSCTLAS
jgi:hypothetical protein